MNMDENYGTIEIHLAELLEQKGINKTQLTHKAEMNWKQVKTYCNNSITRLDIYVLCKLCTVLDCKIEDLLTFVPAEEKEE